METGLRLCLRDHQRKVARVERREQVRRAALERRAAAREAVLLGDRTRPSNARERIDDLAEREPGVELLDELLRERPAFLPADAGVAWLVQVQRCKAWIQAM